MNKREAATFNKLIKKINQLDPVEAFMEGYNLGFESGRADESAEVEIWTRPGLEPGRLVNEIECDEKGQALEEQGD